MIDTTDPKETEDKSGGLTKEQKERRKIISRLIQQGGQQRSDLKDLNMTQLQNSWGLAKESLTDKYVEALQGLNKFEDKDFGDISYGKAKRLWNQNASSDQKEAFNPTSHLPDTSQDPYMGRQAYYTKNLNAGLPAGFINTYVHPTPDGSLHGENFELLTDKTLALRLSNMQAAYDFWKESELTKLRGDISKDLAYIDSARSNRENLRTTMWTALANTMN